MLYGVLAGTEGVGPVAKLRTATRPTADNLSALPVTLALVIIEERPSIFTFVPKGYFTRSFKLTDAFQYRL